MNKPIPRIAVYPNRWMTVLWILLCLGGVAMGFESIVIQGARNVGALLVDAVLLVGITMFALAGFSQMAMLVSAKPSLTVDSRGICVQTGWWGAGLITWEETAAIIVHRLMLMRFVSIIPHDLGPILARQRLLSRIIMSLNMRGAPAPINIPQIWLALPEDELLRQVKRQFADEIRRNHVTVEVLSR